MSQHYNLQLGARMMQYRFTSLLLNWHIACVLSIVPMVSARLIYAANSSQEQVEPTIKAQADKTNQEAIALTEKNDLPGAIEKFKEAYEFYRRARDCKGEAKTLRNIGQAYFSIGKENTDQALGYLNQALSIYRLLGDQQGEGLSLVNIGYIRYKTGDMKGALKLFEESFSLLPESWLRDNEGLLLNMMGDGYYDSGESQKAIETYKRAIRCWETAKNSSQIALLSEQIGIIYLLNGDKSNALEHLKRAQQFWHEANNVRKEAVILQSLGILSGRSGDYVGAVSYYNRALSMMQAANLRREEAELLNLMGIFYSGVGDPQRAHYYHGQALRIWIDLKDHKAQAQTHMHIAQTYRWTGDFISARGPFHAAFDLFKDLNDTKGMASALFYLGLVYEDAGDYQNALDFLNQSLPLSRTVKDLVNESRALKQIGGIYYRQGNKQKALEILEQEIALSQSVPDREFKAHMLFLIGINYAWLGNDREAINYYQQALDLYRANDDKTGISEALAGIGVAYEFSGDFEQALKKYQESILVREEMRTAARLEELQTGIAGRNASTYQYAARLFMQLNRPVQAFELSERARARNLLDQLGNTRIDPRKGADPQIIKREQSLRVELNALEQQHASERARPGGEMPGILPQMPESAQQISSLRHQYAEALSQLKATNPEYVSIRTINPLTLNEVQKLLDAESTLVSYFITLDKTQAFIITRDSFQAVTLPVTEQELYTTISAFRGFADNNNPHPQSLQKLYNWLVKPLNPYLKTSLVGIVPHGVLHYLPFAALTDGKRYFGDEHKLFYLPSTSILPFIQQKRKMNNSTLLSMSQSQPEGLTVLNYADQMATEIAKIYHTTALTSPAATETALRVHAVDSGIIFLAAHGKLNTSSPLFSRIILAPDKENDGLLEVHEVYELDLKKANLVVLSSCQTQLGRQSLGDDIVGLNRAFIYAGTPTVVASLWSVSEKPTSEMIIAFFKNLKNGMGKAAALQAAQAQTRAKYPNPYYWAAFVLTGDPSR